MTDLDLRPSILLALWLPVPSSRGAAVVEGADGAHAVADPEFGGQVPLLEWMTLAGRPERVAAVLPSPSDPLPGLGSALDAGEAVLLRTAAGRGGPHGARTRLLIPEPSGTSAVWRLVELGTGPAGPGEAVPPFDAAHARAQVHAATEEAIAALTELDLARERPELADDLTDLITAVADPRLLPPGMDQRRRELLERSLRLLGICEIALADDGAAATALQAERRARVLRPLRDTARHGVAAATDWWAGAR
ncbi:MULTISPECIES: hypothetical protein [Actinomyces]|uniref:Uncharacterized protein n=1 Tax=Actinomyces marmotae TaxID=2737173 RepID=A0A6M8B4N6_9ACTO|nr:MULTISPECIES: hypothetical protein [Actinomyces]QKD79610.1 hypothetical protein HPC72_04495 [Actinomyces marmotae]